MIELTFITTDYLLNGYSLRKTHGICKNVRNIQSKVLVTGFNGARRSLRRFVRFFVLTSTKVRNRIKICLLRFNEQRCVFDNYISLLKQKLTERGDSHIDWPTCTNIEAYNYEESFKVLCFAAYNIPPPQQHTYTCSYEIKQISDRNKPRPNSKAKSFPLNTAEVL